MRENEGLLRRNFCFDAVGALGTGLFNALVVNFLAVIARREGADPVLLAALAAAPFAANTLAIFSGFWVPSERNRVRSASLLLMGGRGLFLIGVVASGPLALVLMAFGLFLTLAIAAPLQVDVWRGAYPQRLRARVLGYLRVVQTLAGAIGAPLGGMLIERLGPGPMLGLGAGLGMAGATGYSWVRPQPIAASQRFTPADSLRLLKAQPRYRGLILAWVAWGLGALMAPPLFAIVLVDRFQASYSDVGFLQLVGALSGLIAYFVLGQHLDRRGAFGATWIGMLMVALVPIAYLVAPALIWLVAAYVLLSVGNSAIDLGWQLALISRVKDEHRLRYQAAHTSLTGLRGVAAPFLGSLALGAGLGIGFVLVAGGVLGILGSLLMARALGVGLMPNWASGLLGAVVRNPRGPRRDVVVSHGVLRPSARIDEAPLLDSHQVLLSRKQSAAAQAVLDRGGAIRGREATQELVHNPVWHPLALTREDVPEEHQVREQHAPVGAKAT